MTFFTSTYTTTGKLSTSFTTGQYPRALNTNKPKHPFIKYNNLEICKCLPDSDQKLPDCLNAFSMVQIIEDKIKKKKKLVHFQRHRQ